MDSSDSLRQIPGMNPDTDSRGFDVDDDDEYFTELRMRILLLMEDEEDESSLGAKSSDSGTVDPYEESSNLLSPPLLMHGIHFSNKGSVSFPKVQTFGKTGTGSGTGVFIPSANPRRRVCSGLCPDSILRRSACSLSIIFILVATL